MVDMRLPRFLGRIAIRAVADGPFDCATLSLYDTRSAEWSRRSNEAPPQTDEM
jgi:hypothetical protein